MTRCLRVMAAAALLFAAACGAGGTTVDSGPIRIAGNDMLRFVPDKITTSAGTHHFVFKNAGGLSHDLQIGDRYKTGIVAGGQSVTFDVDLPVGTYTFVCKVDNHDKAGMVGTLVVK